MAETTDLQRLVVSLEANIKNYERSLARANGQAQRQTRQIQSRFEQLNRNVSGQMAALGRSMTGVFAGALGAREIVRFADSFTRIQNALRVTGLEGEKLTSVYNQLLASATRNYAPLESLVTLYSRLSLVQGQLGVSSAQIVDFTDRIALALRVGGTSAQEASGALLQLSQALGGGTVRAEEFNSIVEGTPTIALAAARGLEEAGGSIAKLRQLVADGAVPSKAFFDAFIVGSQEMAQQVAGAQVTMDQAWQNIQTALTHTIGQLNQASGVGDIAGVAMQELADEIGRVGANAGEIFDNLRTLVGWLNAIKTAGDNAATAIGNLTGLDHIGPWIERLTGLDVSAEGQSSNAAAKGDRQTRQPTDLGTIRPPVSLRSYAPAPLSGPGGGRSSGASEAERQADAIKRVTEELQFEYDQLGRNELAQRIATEQRAAGVSAASEEGQAIANLVSRNYALEQAQDRATEAQRRLNDALRDVEYMGSSALSSIVTDLKNGESAAKAFEKALDRILDQLIDMASQQLFAAAFSAALPGGGGGMGLFASGIYHSGGVAGQSRQSRSVHPALFAGAPRYHSGGVAGLRPGEVPAILQRGELIIPKGGSRSAAPSLNVNIINNNGSDVRTRQKQGPDGVDIDIVLDQKMAKMLTNPYTQSGKALAQRGVNPPMRRF